MSRRVIGYLDGKPQWQDLGPGYCHIPWTTHGSIAGTHAAPEPRKEGGHTAASYERGVETRRKLRGDAAILRGENAP